MFELNLPGHNFKGELYYVEDKEAGEKDVDGGPERGSDYNSS